jgi:spermidine/putrescine transport system substrate-binding protein
MGKLSSTDRRTVLAGLAGASATALGWSGQARAQAGGEITILTWETYHDDPWIQEYTQKTGVKVNAVRAGSVDEMYAQTRSGAIKPDILYADTGSVPRYKDAGLIEKLDATKVPNRSRISPSMGWEKRLTIDGALWGLPYNWGTQPLMFDRSVVGQEPTSWSARWEPKYAGKVSLFDDAYVTMPMIALRVGAADPFRLTDEEFEKCAEALRTLRPQVGTIARGFDDATTIYAAGDAVIGYCQNVAVVHALNAKGKDFAYSFPAEGTPTWIDCALVTPQGQRPEVYNFINANLDPAWQARFIENSLNNGILTVADAEAAGLAPDVLKKTNVLDQEAAGFWDKMRVMEPPEDVDRRLALWNDFKAGTL